MGASLKNVSQCDSDEVDRLRRLSRLLATSVRRDDSDAGWRQHADTPVRTAEGDDAALTHTKAKSEALKVRLLSLNMTVPLTSTGIFFFLCFATYLFALLSSLSGTLM